MTPDKRTASTKNSKKNYSSFLYYLRVFYSSLFSKACGGREKNSTFDMQVFATYNTINDAVTSKTSRFPRSKQNSYPILHINKALIKVSELQILPMRNAQLINKMHVGKVKVDNGRRRWKR